MPQSSRPSRSRRWVATLPLLLVPLAACSNGEASPSAPPNEDTEATVTTTAGTSTTVTTAHDEQAAALAAYREFWATFDAYSAELAPFDPAEFRDRFGPVTARGQYDHLYQRFQLGRLRGWVSRGGEGDVNRPKIVESSENRMVIEDCADDSGGIYDTRNDTWIEPLTPGARSFFRVVLERIDGRWKVTSVGGEDVPCDA